MKRSVPSMTSLLLILCFLLFGVPAVAQDAGAQEAGAAAPAADHWSGWNPPTSFPPGTQVYTIRDGDTLWDIAQQVYGDPYRWPQLWEQNQYILDANLIYPGDPLVIPQGQQVASGVAGPPLDDYRPDADPNGDNLYGSTGGGFGDDSEDAPVVVSQDEPAEPIQIGYESDIYCTGYIGDVDEVHPFKIASSEYEFLHPSLDLRAGTEVKAEIRGLFGNVATQKYNLGIGDITYIAGGRADGLSAGDILTIIEPGDKISHPATKETAGRFFHYRGRVRVLSVQDETGIGEIIFMCDTVHVGQSLTQFVPEPVPLERLTPMRPVNYPPKTESLEGNPMIILAHDNVVTLGMGSLAFIDQGLLQGIVPGDLYTVYRQGRRGYPPILLGEVGVLSAADNAALVRILRNRYTIHVGDVLEKK